MKIKNWIRNWNQIENKSDIDLNNIEYLLDDNIKWKPIINDDIKWNITGNNPYLKKFIIPIGGKSKDKKKEISNLMKEYKEEFFWNNDTGEINISSTNIPFKKDIWLPTPDDGGVPNIEIL